MGLVLPKVRIRDNLNLSEDQYRIKINGNSVASASLPVDQLLVFPAPNAESMPSGTAVRHPAFSRPLVAIPPDGQQAVQRGQHKVLDAAGVVLQHLRQVVAQHAAELLTRDATKHLIEETRRTAPAVVDELIPNVMKLADVQRILRRLLTEGISIRQLSTILEVLGDEAGHAGGDIELTELVRRRLARTICAQYRDTRDRLHVITLDPALEDRVRAEIQILDREVRSQMTVQEVEGVCRAIDRELAALRQQQRPLIVLVRPEIRVALKRLTANSLPQLIVLSYAEITAETKLVSLGIVSDTQE
jgi:flagellar biosynthesis protein FlhA